MQNRLKIQLKLMDVAAGAALLRQQFAMQPQPSGGLALGSLQLELVAVVEPPSHGQLDHLALRVPDLPACLAQVEAAGGRIDRAVTDGLQEIPEFWDSGFSYVFVKGPEGARFELCTPKGATAPWGFDHLGIPCADLSAMRAFFIAQGFEPVSDVQLQRDSGPIDVSFLRFGADMVELYSAPEHRINAQPFVENGFFGLVMQGNFAAAEIQGPEGLRVMRAPLGG